MNWLLLGGITFAVSIPFHMSHLRYKHSYRRRNPGCAFIPPTGNSWIAAALQTVSLFAFIFTVDPGSWESLRGAFYGTF